MIDNWDDEAPGPRMKNHLNKYKIDEYEMNHDLSDDEP